jgi:ethanolamine utilization protein EutA
VAGNRQERPVAEPSYSVGPHPEATQPRDEDDGFKIEEIFGIEAFKQKSVGIDIGSSTSHLIFSELTLRREAASSQFRVTDRQVLYESPILLTPYVSGTLIDTDALRSFVEETYFAAQVAPEDVDTGAIIITGEALKKENSQPIVEMFAAEVGKFICAAAGHNHEGLLAAYGSGAVGVTLENRSRLLNVDMGGGTAKFAFIDNGNVVETMAVSVGARLIAYDQNGIVTRVEDPARIILGDDASQLVVGKPVTDELKLKLAERQVEVIFDLILARPHSTLTDALMVTPAFSGYEGLSSIDHVSFSGGVSEYVYGRDAVAYGDLGPLLGQGVRNRFEELPGDLLTTLPSGIRATVIGAGEYTIQASGNTSYLSNEDLLPVHALKVIKTPEVAPDGLPAAVSQALHKFDLEAYTGGLALSIALDETLTYPYLRAVAEGITAVLNDAAGYGGALFLLVDRDVAKSIGAILKEELDVPNDIIAIDGIDLGDLDYIDIGKPMGATEVLPVTVKSLIFPSRVDAQPA